MGKGSVATLEKKWQDAKAAAAKQYPDMDHESDRFYAIVMTIFKKMAGVDEGDVIGFSEYLADRLDEGTPSGHPLAGIAKTVASKFPGTRVTLGPKNKFGLVSVGITFASEKDAAKLGPQVSKFLKDANLYLSDLNNGKPIKTSSMINGKTTSYWKLDAFQKKLTEAEAEIMLDEGKMSDAAQLISDFEMEYGKDIAKWDVAKVKKNMQAFGKKLGYSPQIVSFAVSQLG